MSQHDYNIANASGATVRADINSLVDAIATLNSGATAPSVTVANMWWFDTANNLLKQRDNANTAWITIASKVTTTWVPYSGGNALTTGAFGLTMLAAANAAAALTLLGTGSAALVNTGTADVNVPTNLQLRPTKTGANLALWNLGT